MGNINVTYGHTLDDVNDLLSAIAESIDSISSEISDQSLLSDRRNENLEDVTLIWLDGKISLSRPDHQKTFQGLREINNFTKFCTDPHRCIKYIETIGKEKVFVIISGSLATEKDVLSQIQSFKTVDSIFIFCINGLAYASLRNSPKIVGIFTEQELLMEAIKKRLDAVLKQRIAFSFFNGNCKTHRNVTEDNASFLSFQLLFDLLKEMAPIANTKEELLKLCEAYYYGRESEKKNIEDFRDHYKCKSAIKWYTEESFVYHTLNKALRTEDIEGLYLFHFYIVDLWNQLKTKSLENKKLEVKCRRMNNGKFVLFRGQKMSKEELNKFQRSKGSLISPNGFFSTSIEQICALNFIDPSESHDSCAILFKITVDNNVKSGVFAYIEDLTAIKGEEEVLFSIGAVFKVNDVILDRDIVANLPIWVIDMTLTDEGMGNVQEYIDSVKYDFADTDKQVIFGHLLIEMNELAKAEKYFNFLLQSVEKSSLKEADVLDGIGDVFFYQLEKDLALDYYQKAYAIRLKLRDQKSDLRIAFSLNNIGSVILATGDHKEARSYFRDVLNILQNYYQHEPWMANTLVNLAQCYMQQDEDSKIAFDYLKRALEIRKKISSKQYRAIGNIYHTIGMVYYKMKEYDDALKYYFDAFEQFDKILLKGHSKFPNLFGDIINVYKVQNDFDSAFYYWKEKLGELQKELDQTHPNIARMYVIRADMYYACKEDKDALRDFQKALEIFEKCIPPEKRQLLICHNRLGIIYIRQNEFQKGLEHSQQALQIARTIFLPKHPEVARSLLNMGAAYLHLENYGRAKKYLMDAQDIFQSKFSADHEEVKIAAKLIDLANNKSRQNLDLFNFYPYDSLSRDLMLDLEMELMSKLILRDDYD